jgi:hypothetical protein
MLKHAVFLTLLALGTTTAWAGDMSTATLAEARTTQSTGMYAGLVTGTVWTLINSGMLSCPPAITGGVVQQALAALLGSEVGVTWAKTPFTVAVYGAMLQLGCTVPEPKAEAKAYY